MVSWGQANPVLSFNHSPLQGEGETSTVYVIAVPIAGDVSECTMAYKKVAQAIAVNMSTMEVNQR